MNQEQIYLLAKTHHKALLREGALAQLAANRPGMQGTSLFGIIGALLPSYRVAAVPTEGCATC